MHLLLIDLGWYTTPLANLPYYCCRNNSCNSYHDDNNNKPPLLQLLKGCCWKMSKLHQWKVEGCWSTLVH